MSNVFNWRTSRAARFALVVREKRALLLVWKKKTTQTEKSDTFFLLFARVSQKLRFHLHVSGNVCGKSVVHNCHVFYRMLEMIDHREKQQYLRINLLDLPTRAREMI